jgi:hypothetical protein
MKEVGRLETLLADIFQHTHHVLMPTVRLFSTFSPPTSNHRGDPFSCLPLRSLSHIPCYIPHFLPLGEKLVEIGYALSILRQKLRLARHRLA